MGGDEGRELGDKFLNDIIQFNIKTQSWENSTLGVKQMIDRRSQFGLSIVTITEDITSECDFVPYPFKGLWSHPDVDWLMILRITRPGVEKVKPKVWFKYSL